jgi:hypothetical protein
MVKKLAIVAALAALTATPAAAQYLYGPQPYGYVQAPAITGPYGSVAIGAYGYAQAPMAGPYGSVAMGPYGSVGSYGVTPQPNALLPLETELAQSAGNIQSQEIRDYLTSGGSHF